MDLKDIGFYTLSNDRAFNASTNSPLWRCELVLTDRCTFNCPYCRGLRDDISGDISLESAKNTLKIWIDNGLKNVRFTGGEPTIYNGLEELIEMCVSGGVERIAVSTNGYSPTKKYDNLIKLGVNDFSISLDSGCCAVGDRLAGGINGAWDKVVDNIKHISKTSYVSLGMVFTPDNIDTCVDDVLFADSLGISDIRVIPSAQFNEALIKLSLLPDNILNRYPILKYRINNIKNKRHVRGIKSSDCDKCWLALDDMAVAQGKHFKCIIHLREGGDSIGDVTDNIREDRLNWIASHNPKEDKVCAKNCLDVCVDYNNTANKTHKIINGKLYINGKEIYNAKWTDS